MLLIQQSDALSFLRTLPDNSVDSLVTDPPAGISFCGEAWDDDKGGRKQWTAWLTEILSEAHRVLKPGAHALIWALPRTCHWTGTAIEDAGFEVRDCLSHVYATGFPKSHDISKAIDEKLGVPRRVVGKTNKGDMTISYNGFRGAYDITTPASPEAIRWDDWGTALKPAHEKWFLCRKPLSEKSIAANVLRWGTGGVNIGATRVETKEPIKINLAPTGTFAGGELGRGNLGIQTENDKGRFTPNFLLSHAPECSEVMCDLFCPLAQGNGMDAKAEYFPVFRYSAKPSTSEKEAGLDHLETKKVALSGGAQKALERGEYVYETESGGGFNMVIKRKNTHRTVKGIDLMRWLVRLITPPGGVVLDCFMGSGTTGCAAVLEGCSFIGCDLSEEFVTIATARINHWATQRT